ncbi:MAG: hypothetical protein GY715_14815 [Planctomycetes bacterium]|nr:hypothetical protein [Planctomycetota bacterium]
MRLHQTIRLVGLLGVLAVLGTGCVSFSGPNDVRRAIAKQENVRLEEEMGVTVGPVGVFLANTLAGGYLPINMDGIKWVSFGQYSVSRAEPVCMRDLDLPGWQRIARMCEPSEEVIVMVPAGDGPLRKLLVVQREGGEVHIVKAEGDLERIIDRLLESDLVDDDILDFMPREPAPDQEAEPTELVVMGPARGWVP